MTDALDKLRSAPPNDLLVEEILLGRGAPPNIAREAGELFKLMSDPIHGREVQPDAVLAALGFMSAYVIEGLRDKEGEEEAQRGFSLLQATIIGSLE